jgi:hypothetical protein
VSHPDALPPSGLRRRRTVVCAAGSAALSLTAALLVASGNLGLLPFAAWLVALGLTVVLAHRREGQRLERRDLLALAAIIAVGACFRLWRISDIPSGPWVDELAAAANAVTLWARHPFTPFGSTPLFAIDPEWVRTTNLYLYLCQGILWLTGYSQLGVKLLSILPGIAAPPLVYLLARRFLPRSAAFLAGALLAVSHWHVIDSRWGWDEVLVTALTVAIFAALLNGGRREHPSVLLIAGLLAGLAQYAYAAARVAALAALLFLILEFAFVRRRVALAGLGLFLLGFAQAVLPMAVYWAEHPSTFAVREREVSIVPEMLGGNIRPLAHNMRAYALMFLVHGDRNPRQNLPEAPMLDPATGALFAIGLVVAVAGWRRAESRAVLLWLSVGLLGGLLTLPDTAPNSYRVGLLAPACVVLAGMGWAAIVRFARARLPGLAPVLPVAAAAVIAFVGTVTYLDYFVTRPASRECWLAVEEGAYCEILRKNAVRVLDCGGQVFLDRHLRWITTALQFDTLLRRARPETPVRWVDAPGVKPENVQRAVLFVPRGGVAALPAGLAALPARGLRTPFGDEPFVAVSGDPALLRAVAP